MCTGDARQQKLVGRCQPGKMHFFKIPELMLNIPRDVPNVYKAVCGRKNQLFNTSLSQGSHLLMLGPETFLTPTFLPIPVPTQSEVWKPCLASWGDGRNAREGEWNQGWHPHFSLLQWVHPLASLEQGWRVRYKCQINLNFDIPMGINSSISELKLCPSVTSSG